MSRQGAEIGGLRRSLRLTWPHLRPHRPLLAGGLLAMLAGIVLRLAEPWPIKVVVDVVTSPARREEDLLPTLVLMSGAVLVIAAGRAGAEYASTVMLALAGSRAATALRAATFDHVVSLSLRQHGRLRTGDLVTRVVGDVGRLQEVATTAGLPLVGNVATTVAMLAVILWIDPMLAGTMLLAILAFVVMSRRGSRGITTAAARSRRAEGDLATEVAESVGALTVVQAFGLERTRAEAFRAANKQALGEGVRAKRLSAALERRTDVVAAVATAVVLGVGGWRVTTGSISVGDLVLFLAYLRSALKPLRDVAKYTGRIAKAFAASDRIADLLAEEPEIRDHPATSTIERRGREQSRREPARGEPARGVAPTAVHLLSGAIKLEGVTLAYVPDHEVLRDVTLSIAAGERVALVGPSGGGKTSLASLILRLVEPTSGRICFDGIDARELPVASVRSQIAFMPQEPVLFAVSVRENIRYGRLDADDATVEAAAQLANADGFIRRLPHGYETVVGERGATLSGGQRQRVALARALLRDAPIVVLDEATSNVDPESAEEIRVAVRALTDGRTTIVITHDDEGLDTYDRVLFVEGGRVRSIGRSGADRARNSLLVSATAR